MTAQPPKGVSLREWLLGRDLSKREMAVLKLSAEGFSNEQIGATLGLVEDTVKSRQRRIFAKLGATNRAHSIAIAYQKHLLAVTCEACTEREAP